MELDELKLRWQDDISRNSPLAKKSKAQIEALLVGKTADYVSSMRKKYQRIMSSLIFSMLAMIFIFSIISDGFSYPGAINGFVMVVFFFSVIIAFLWLKLINLLNFELSDSIRERITQVIGLHTKNRWSEIAFILSFLMGLIVIGSFMSDVDTSLSENTSVYIGLGLMVLFAVTLITVIFNRYGKRIGELKEYLQEFEQISVNEKS